MERKNIDWGNLGFGYVQTDMRYVSNFRNGQWDDGCLTDQATITMSECACVLQYAQTCFEGLKAYTTEDGRIVCFRPDLNAQRMANSCRRLKMPVFPEERFVQAVVETVRANSQWVPPYGSGRYAVCAPVHVWQRRHHRRQARDGVSVPGVRHPCRPLFQRRHQAPEAANFRS